jgi:hypothetical protein
MHSYRKTINPAGIVCQSVLSLNHDFGGLGGLRGNDSGMVNQNKYSVTLFNH